MDNTRTVWLFIPLDRPHRFCKKEKANESRKEAKIFLQFRLFGQRVNVPILFCGQMFCVVFCCCCRCYQPFSITFFLPPPQHLHTKTTRSIPFYSIRTLVIFVYSLIECRFATEFIVNVVYNVRHEGKNDEKIEKSMAFLGTVLKRCRSRMRCYTFIHFYEFYMSQTEKSKIF